MAASREPTPRGRLLRLHPWLVGVALVLAVLAVVVGALGGFARTTPEGLQVVEPGVEVEASPLRVRLDRAEATYEVSGRAAEEGRAYLVVEGTLALDGGESVGSGIVTDSFAAGLPLTYDLYENPSKGGELSSVQVAADGSILLGLGPGLTYDVLLVFDVDEGAVPAELTVSLLEHTFRASSLDASTIGWFDAAPFAQVTLDVAPLPAVRPADEDLL